MADAKKPLGVLILHGFTGSLDTVRPVAPVAEKLGLPWRMPVLRGHGTRYEDLVGVSHRDWVADAQSALDDLLGECERVAIVALSMGGLVALDLATEYGDRLAGLVLLAPALRMSDPLSPLTPLLKYVFPFWDSPNSFRDMERAKASTNYKRFPTATAQKLLEFAAETERKLPAVTVPTTILYSRRDQIVHPIIIKLLEEKLASREKEFVFFEKSGHEMLQDCETEAVVAAVERALEKHVAAATQKASA